MNSRNIGNLKVNIGADTGELSRGIGRAKAMMNGLARTARVAGAAAGATYAAASVGMVLMARKGLDFVDSQAKTARSVDGTIDGLRALQIAGGDAGVSLETISKAAQDMGKRIAEAARDGFGPAHEALEMIGLSASDLMKMDVDTRFAAIADRAKELGFNAQQSADLMRQFGVRSAEVSLLMAQGGTAIRAARVEVQKFGLSMSEDAAAKVEIANDALSRIGFVFEAMRNQLAVGLAPVLQQLSITLQDATTAGGPLQQAISALVVSFSDMATVLLDPAFISAATLFGATLADAVSGLARALVFVADNAAIAGTAMIALGGAMAFFSGPIGLAVAAVSGGIFLLSTRMDTSATSADTAKEAYDRLQGAIENVDLKNEDAIASGEILIATHIDQARAALEAARANLALAKSKEQAGNALLDQNPLTAGGNSGMSEEMAAVTKARQADFDASMAEVDRRSRLLEGFRRSQFPSRASKSSAETKPTSSKPDGVGTGVSKLKDDLVSLISVIDPAAAKVAKMQAAMQLLTQAKMDGLITDEEYILRAKQIKEAFAETPAPAHAAAAGIKAVSAEMKKAEKVSEDTETGWDSAFKNLINNIDQGKDALKSFVVELAKMAAIRGISKLLGGSSWFDGPLIGKNAMGTDNWRGGLSWVGERGPELVNLPMGAQVIPNNKLGGASGGTSFTYAPVIDAKGASLAAVQELEARMRADGAQFNAKVNQAIYKAKAERKI